MERDILILRKFFKLSNSLFDFCNDCEMKELHKLALEELEKDNPNLSIVEKLLRDMELLTNPKPKFPKGGHNV